MFIRTILIAIATTLVSLQVWAQDTSALRDAERLGQQLYELDRAIQVAWDAGEQQRGFRRDKQVEGWVSELRGDTYWITFVGLDRSREPVGLYQAAVSRSGQLVENVQRLNREPLSGSMARQFSARQSAAKQNYTSCSNDYEIVAIQDSLAGNDGWRVWLLPRSAFPDVHLMGGTYRADVASPGDAVLQFAALAEGCSVLQIPEDAEALRFDDATGQGPNELHAYANRVSGKDLYVTSAGTTWLVQNGQIHNVN